MTERTESPYPTRESHRPSFGTCQGHILSSNLKVHAVLQHPHTVGHSKSWHILHYMPDRPLHCHLSGKLLFSLTDPTPNSPYYFESQIFFLFPCFSIPLVSSQITSQETAE